jgi:alpha-galactosidase
VEIQTDGIHLKTGQAEFVLTRSGSLVGRFKHGTQWLTLDEAAPGPGVVVTSGKQVVNDFIRDLGHARIQPANGKLGSLGKRVEVQGHSSSTGLDEILTVEVYDDFSSLALLSASYRNSGEKEIALDKVTLQNHSLNASLADSNAKPHEMWAFFGSSLKWGKDDVLPIPARFSQDNPFGAPVETHDDLGRVGGGVPVVAFWTRDTGLAIGHLETVPLALSIPVQTTADGRLDAAVDIPAATTLKPGESFSTPRTFVTVFHGDYYEPLSTWSQAVERRD